MPRPPPSSKDSKPNVAVPTTALAISEACSVSPHLVDGDTVVVSTIPEGLHLAMISGREQFGHKRKHVLLVKYRKAQATRGHMYV